ncbi:MAG TPA: hypothetical protein VG867_07330 [Rhizomicrobium sp.]|nr:hypothetical protein [Rhizomicrobium sp.]
MAVTTVLSDESTTAIVTGGNDNEGFFRHRFSWSSTFAGAFVAVAVTLFLLALGSGLGLVLVSPDRTSVPAFLTLGAIYFFAAQAFGFAVGGHITGRLIGPAPETAKEENFRSAAHGLVVWALTVMVTASLIALGSIVAGNMAITAAASSTRFAPAQPMSSNYVSYWVDMLFRPAPGPSQAWLGGTQYAQADTGNATDASPQQQAPAATPSPDFPETSGPFANTPSKPQQATPPTTPEPETSEPETTAPEKVVPEDVRIPQSESSFTAPASLAADKAEVGRILTVGMANGARLSQYDKDRIAALIVQDTSLPLAGAQRRVDNAESRIHDDEVKALDVAKKTASYASLWIAASLLFGAIVSVAAAISARWQDDRITFGWPRQEPQ